MTTSNTGTTGTTSQRGDGHLVVYWLWPMAVAVTLAGILAISAGGIVAIFAGWKLALTIAGVTFFVCLAIGTVGLFVYVLGEWAGPAMAQRVANIQAQASQPITVIETEHEDHFIPVGGRNGRIQRDAPALPSGASRSTVRDGINAAVGLLADKFKTRAVQTMATDTPALAPVAVVDAPAWVTEFHTVLCGMWGQKLTRKNFESTFDGGQSLYKKYVAGTGTGRSQCGLWDRWQIIERGSDGRGTWRFCYDLPSILARDPDLQAYASARAAMVDHSPGGSGKGQKTVLAVTEPNRTKKPNQKPIEKGV